MKVKVGVEENVKVKDKVKLKVKVRITVEVKMKSSIEHLLRELGDVFWYYSQACMALGFDFDKVVAQNMAKLLARYPTGAFEVTRSENRQAGDL